MPFDSGAGAHTIPCQVPVKVKIRDVSQDVKEDGHSASEQGLWQVDRQLAKADVAAHSGCRLESTKASRVHEGSNACEVMVRKCTRTMKTLCSSPALTSPFTATSSGTARVVTFEVTRFIEDSSVGSEGSSADSPILAAKSDKTSWWILNSKL